MNVKNQKIKQDVECGLNINWFPGHMKKSLEEINNIVSKVNLIIEVVDARAMNTSSNYELLNIAKNKPILKIALKSDYCDIKNSDYTFICTTKDKNLRNKIISEINKKLEEQFNSARRKGLMHPKFIILVIGLPNVGKSTLINILKNKNTLITQNFPGVTKKQTIVSINNELNLIDTPGVLFKHIEKIEDAYKLTLINCIKKEIVPLDKVLEYGFKHYYTFHKQELFNYYEIDKEINSYEEFVNYLANKRKWFNNKQEIDLNRLETNLFNDFSMSKICPTNFEKEN